ncbi:MAG: acyl carrier protein [Acidobacteria bacterium]|nr:acyl carrier protein [Acidobacteriota bacterium]MBI3263655.1 acyl carrier protein [Acidobacteriota bacterium]
MKLFAEKLHVEVPSPNVDLVEIGVLDSLGFVTLLMHLEEDFGVAVPIEDLDVERFRSVARITGYLSERLLTPAA